MSAGWLFVVITALAWSGMDALRKVLAARIEPLPLAGLLMLGQLPLYLIWTALDGRATVASGYWLPGIIDVACNLVAQVLFVSAVRASPLSRTIPMLSFTPVFAVGTGALILGELPGPLQVVGIGGVVLGAMLLQLERGDLGALGRFLRAWAREPGVPMMLGVASLWSVTMVLDKLCLRYAAVPMHALLHVSGMCLGLLTLLALRGQTSKMAAAQAHWRPYLASIVVVGVATASQLLAVQVVLVSVVEAVKRATGLAAAVVNGRLLFDEAITRRKVAAVVVMAVGVGAVVLGG